MGAVCCRQQVQRNLTRFAWFRTSRPLIPFLKLISPLISTPKSTSFTSISFVAWAKALLERSALAPRAGRKFSIVLTRTQVRVVQHKQSKDIYALKYINKARCVKQKAVSNIIQERRLLEEVRCHI